MRTTNSNDDSRKGIRKVGQETADVPWVEQSIGENDMRGTGADVARAVLLQKPLGARDDVILLLAVRNQVMLSPVSGREHVGDIVCVHEPD